METSKSVEQPGSGEDRMGKIGENQECHNRLGLICLNLFDEDMSLIKIHRICGKDPVNGIELTNVHFLTVDFLTISQLKHGSLYTENELEEIRNDMSGFVGVRLTFLTRGSSDTPYGLSRTVYAGISINYPLNVYKYDCLKYQLLCQYALLKPKIGESESDGDSSEYESLSSSSSLNEDDSETMTSSSSSDDDDADDDDDETEV
jgi:hypothetical protein